MCSYASHTFKDKNYIKRLLQIKRLEHSFLWLKSHQINQEKTLKIIDWGGGNGELCKLLVDRFPEAQIFCYEPWEQMREEAISNLENFPGVKIIGNVSDLPPATFDIIFCLEVFEHLPPQETEAAIYNISQILKPSGYACIGVPNEIYLPALIKGLFRMTRRYGAYDANWTNLIAATLGNPPKDRPVDTVQEKLFLHFHHMGFDFREFCKNISRKLDIEKIWGSPIMGIPAIFNFEVYFLCRHKK